MHFTFFSFAPPPSIHPSIHPRKAHNATESAHSLCKQNKRATHPVLLFIPWIKCVLFETFVYTDRLETEKDVCGGREGWSGR
jgi:hypothetical protein